MAAKEISDGVATDSLQVYLSQISYNVQELTNTVSELSLNQQRDSVRLELLEKRGVLREDPLRSQDNADSPADPAVLGLGSGPRQTVADSNVNPLLLLADCAQSQRLVSSPPVGEAHSAIRFTEEEECKLFQAAESIRDRVKHQALPGELVLPTTQGVRVGDRKRAAVIRASAGYVTTCLKLLKTFAATDQDRSEANTHDLFTVLYTHMRHLQKDLNECVLEANTPKVTMDYFKYLNSNDKCLTRQECKNFETACNWTLSAQRAAEAERRGRPGSRSRGRGFGNRRSYGNYQSDSYRGKSDRYQNIVSSFDQSFPPKKDQEF